MFTPNNFYKYIKQYLASKDPYAEPQWFNPHGSRDLHNVRNFGDITTPQAPVRFTGQVALFDQEPIELDYFKHWRDFDPADLHPKTAYFKSPNYSKKLSETDFIFYRYSGVYTPILCHSETNSDGVDLFANNYFHPVHYFFHGLLAREWFRHWKHYSMPQSESANRLGLYARAADGSRSYRLTLLEKLIPFKDSVYYRLQPEIADLMDPAVKRNWRFNTESINAEYSAKIVQADTANFKIQLVPETLFDTEKTHLTEKVFKPIVMQQPFIVVGPPGSLEYMRHYGFRTFDGLWDESYDKEMNADRRMEKIIQVVEYLTSLNDEAFNRILDRAQRTIQHNLTRFYSHEFEDQILQEMYSNFETALIERNKQFYTMPGGTWFHYQNKLLNEGVKPPAWNKKINANILTYLTEINEPDVAKEIIKKYPNLI